MTRSRRAEPLFRNRGRLLSLAVGAVVACGPRELSLGGDPVTLGIGVAAGGRTTSGGAPSSSGGTTSGSGGSGSIIIPNAGSGGAAAGGAGGEADNPYPPVRWSDGQGYRDVCPEMDGVWGFTCWHDDSGTATLCTVDGAPACNACSCAVPCETPSDCPSGVLGAPAGCFGADTGSRSCFLTCADAPCPAGMSCSTYPGTSDRVCMWVEPDVSMLPPAK